MRARAAGAVQHELIEIADRPATAEATAPSPSTRQQFLSGPRAYAQTPTPTPPALTSRPGDKIVWLNTRSGVFGGFVPRLSMQFRTNCVAAAFSSPKRASP
jgi:hypothetical protein